MKRSIIILAAGLGKRMYSELPKVLHRLAGKSLLQHVLDTARTLEAESIHVVYGHGGEQVRTTINEDAVHWVEQSQQLGTGHAVVQAMPHISDEAHVLILYGDVPLISQATLQRLFAKVDERQLALLTVELSNPTGYGRIVRNSAGQVERIVEEKEADADIKRIQEVNTGIIAMPAAPLCRWLSCLKSDNTQGEYYLTDIIALAVAEGFTIHTELSTDIHEVMGVNDRVQLGILERYYQTQQATELMRQGVTIQDPNRFDLRGTLIVGTDVTIDVNVILEGKVTLGNRVYIGPHTVIRNAQIGDDVQIFSHCAIENVIINAQCRIGPFARLRPETVLAEKVHIGNFVEIKKSTVAQGTKINHLSYIGDSEVGKEVNIGAGTITCNYDGAYKHKTVIGDGVFIGSDTQLIAPVTVGKNATIGAGSTITKNVPPDILTLSRTKQQSFTAWQRPQKKK